MKLNIYKYTSALVYLQDFYKHEKKASSITVTDWAISMGLKSPLLMIEILKGKRPIKLKYSSFLSTGLNLNGQELIYFKTLIQMVNTTKEEQSYYHSLLVALRPSMPVDKNGEVFSNWLNGAILAMSKSDDFCITPLNIQNSLKVKVSLDDIESSLHILYEKGLFHKKEDASYERNHPEFVATKNDQINPSVHNYYKETFTSAIDAINYPVIDREFQCFAICAKSEKIGEIKEILRKTRNDISSLWDKDGDKVFQFNLLGYPIAEFKDELKMKQKNYTANLNEQI